MFSEVGQGTTYFPPVLYSLNEQEVIIVGSSISGVITGIQISVQWRKL